MSSLQEVVSRREVLWRFGIASGVAALAAVIPDSVAVAAESNVNSRLTALLEIVQSADYTETESGDAAMASYSEFIDTVDPMRFMFDRATWQDLRVVYHNISAFFRPANRDSIGLLRDKITVTLGEASLDEDPLKTAGFFFYQDIEKLAMTLQVNLILPFVDEEGNISVTDKALRTGASLYKYKLSQYIAELPDGLGNQEQGVNPMTRYWKQAGINSTGNQGSIDEIRFEGLNQQEEAVVKNVLADEQAVFSLLSAVTSSKSTTHGFGMVSIEDGGKDPMEIYTAVIDQSARGSTLTNSELAKRVIRHEVAHLKDVLVNFGPLYAIADAGVVCELLALRELSLEPVRTYLSLENLASNVLPPNITSEEYVSRRFNPQNIDDLRYALGVYAAGLHAAVLSGSQLSVEHSPFVSEEIDSSSPYVRFHNDVVNRGFDTMDNRSCGSLDEYFKERKKQLEEVTKRHSCLEEVFNFILDHKAILEPREWLEVNKTILANQESASSDSDSKFLPTLTHPLFRGSFKQRGTIGEFDRYVIGCLTPVIMTELLRIKPGYREKVDNSGIASEEFIRFSTQQDYGIVDAELFAELARIAQTVPDEVINQDSNIKQAVLYMRQYNRAFDAATQYALPFKQLNGTEFIFDSCLR